MSHWRFLHMKAYWVVPLEKVFLLLYLTVFELLCHYAACWESDVEGGVLLWVGGGDDGHQMEPVWGVHLKHTKMVAYMFKYLKGMCVY